MNTRWLIALMWVVLCSVAAGADDAVRLATRTFTPPESADIAADLSRFAGRHALVQLHATPDRQQREALACAGVRLLRPLSGRVWLAAIEDRTFTDRAAVAAVRWAGGIETTDKVDPRVCAGDFLPHSALPDGRRAIDVGFHRDVPEATARAILEDAGGEVLDYARTTNSFIAALAPEDAVDLAEWDEVLSVNEAGPTLSPVLDVAKPAIGGDVANQPPYSATGAGVTAFVLDGGTIASGENAHPDLAGRVTVMGVPVPDVIGHPTHVSCIVGGSGYASGGRYQGIAPAVQILSASLIPGFTMPPMYDNPGNLESAYQKAVQEHGATVSNNSIGSNIYQFGTRYCVLEGDYERSAQVIDAIVHEEFGRITVVWANGNERGNNDGPCGNTYHTTPPPATAKNSIAVGAVEKGNLAMTEFSSWGPTDDGRIRPDVTAPGCGANGIVSCAGPLSGADYIGMCGTSMACPMVTGAVALLQEYWRTKRGEWSPAASTMKALVIHGAAPVGEDGPDFSFGYGVVQVPNSLDLIDQAIIVEGSLDQGTSYTHDYLPTGEPIRATLVWSDPPGEHLAPRALVNDLDLFIVTPDGAELPWVLNALAPDEPATKGGNHLDPVEQVEFSPAATDVPVQVVVSATEVPLGPQFFSLVLTGLEEVPPPADDDTDDDVDDDAAQDADDDDDGEGGCGC